MKVKFSVPCMAVYVAEMEIEDDELAKELIETENVFELKDEVRWALLDYINFYADEVNVTDLEWVCDLEIEDDDIIYITNSDV